MFGNIYKIVIKNASNLQFVSYYLSILFQNNAVGRTSAFGVEKGAINVPLNRLNSVQSCSLSSLSSKMAAETAVLHEKLAEAVRNYPCLYDNKIKKLNSRSASCNSRTRL